MGKQNAITDVKGVHVGHTTLKNKCTGVTALFPNDNPYLKRVRAGAFVLNGAGEMTGLLQIQEWGLIETPILLTHTLAVGTCYSACVKYLIKKHPSLGRESDVAIPVVGECDDSWLNDIQKQSITEKHVLRALQKASSQNTQLEKIQQGCVGAGTGMVAFDLKGGVGTASRCISIEKKKYTLGVLVVTNLGKLENLIICGKNIGKTLSKKYPSLQRRKHPAGSMIGIVATDAPLVSAQLRRIAKRAALGVAKVGSFAAHGSGEIFLAFTTANPVPRNSRESTEKIEVLLDPELDPLFEAALECTEEAILNSLFEATDTTGRNGHFVPKFRVCGTMDEHT